ncbi:ABC transporter ATP-binding protein [Breznakia blatticola]|nr:ATP-binding cassette domain-containing protein [Breznakia blatticola]
MKFGDVQALNEVNLDLEDGVYGLIGPNGSGKSTLINCITTLIKQTSGTITFNEKEVNQKYTEYQNSIGLMPQNIDGFDDFTGIRFLYYIATLKGLLKEDATTQINRLVKRVNLENVIHRKIKTYSGGMKQRLLFIQALLSNPKIIILDEPTAGLDPFERINLRNYISEISDGRIVIIATHVMQDIESIANSIILIRDGKVVKNGKPEELIQSIKPYVHEKMINESDLPEYRNKYKISSVSKLREGMFIRYLKEEATKQTQAIPSLEEVYLYYLT